MTSKLSIDSPRLQVRRSLRNKARLVQVTLVAFLTVSMTAAVFVPKANAGSPDSSSSQTPDNGTQATEQTLSEAQQALLDKVQPAPKLSTSLERDNLIKKLNITNNAHQLGYVYLLGLNGQVIANYTINGKVSSLNSYLTTTEQLRCQYNGSSGIACNTMQSPDLDGSYGNNPSGIFFFTTSGAYVEWSGSYMYSTQPLNIQTPVSLTEQVK